MARRTVTHLLRVLFTIAAFQAGCGASQAAVSVEGIEVTQAIQYYRAEQHLKDERDRGSDNSIRLVEGKSALARVYVRESSSGDATKVTGELVLERFEADGWKTVATIDSEQSTTAAAGIPYSALRSDLARTLNFRIMPEQVRGLLRLTAHVRLADREGTVASKQIVLEEAVRRRIQIAAVMIGYDGPDRNGRRLVLDPPTVDDLQRTASMTLAAFPVSAAAQYRIAGTLTLHAPMDLVTFSGCPARWTALMAQIRAIVKKDGSRRDWVYFGLMPAKLPFAGRTVGCGGGGVGTGRVGEAWTMAHELGHAAGLNHAPGKTSGCTISAPDADPMFPSYEPYQEGSIGEYGFDLRTSRVLSPESYVDLMGYCSPEWISIYSYQKLMTSSQLQAEPQVSTAEMRTFGDQALDSAAEPSISVIGTADANGRIKIEHVTRNQTTEVAAGLLVEDLTADLLADGGSVVASAPVYATPLSAQTSPLTTVNLASGPGVCSCLIETTLPALDGGSGIRIRRGDEELWREDASFDQGGQPLDVSISRSNTGLRLAWKPDGYRQGDWWVHYTKDDGATWQLLGLSTVPGSFELPLALLPEGHVRFQVSRDDGLTTEEAQTEMVFLRSN